jgi:hypothetical protein
VRAIKRGASRVDGAVKNDEANTKTTGLIVFFCEFVALLSLYDLAWDLFQFLPRLNLVSLVSREINPP